MILAGDKEQEKDDEKKKRAKHGAALECESGAARLAPQAAG